MFFNPASCLFATTLILGILIASSSPSWFLSWTGLELNVLSFIPLILSKSKNSAISAEAALTYFLVQAAGSTTMLAGAITAFYFSQVASTIITAALLLKMGAAPLHFWLPRLMQGLSWNQCLVLMTAQKIAPLTLISYCMNSMTCQIIMMSSITSAIAGSLGGLNQTLVRKILAYSSINHMAWMLSALVMGSQLWFCYLLVYSVVSLSLVLLLNHNQIFHIKDFSCITTTQFNKILMFTSIFSLGGLPPFLGFLPKLLMVQELMTQQEAVWAGTLMLSSLVTLYYYMRVLMMTLTFPVPKTSMMPMGLTYKPATATLANIILPFVPMVVYIQF